MQRNLEFSISEYYHLYNRGVEKRKIFLDDSDRKRFLTLLHVCNSSKPVVFKTIQGLPLDKVAIGTRLVAIGAYCLMPNHVHILVREIIDNGISLFTEKIFTAYSMYFNRKYERKGRLYENNFQAKEIHDDEYLKYLYAYIHLNPVKLIQSDWKEIGIKDKTKVKKFLEEYTHSSYLDFISLPRPEKIILDKAQFPDYFQGHAEFDDFINDWLYFRGLPLEV